MEGLKELLKELLLINSSTKEGSNKAIEYCGQWLEENGLPVNIIENNGYKMLVSEIGSGDKKVIFNGHIDVVSGKEEQFVPREKNEKIYARGSADMKAGVACMMKAMAALKDEDLHTKIQLQIVSDEEIGGFNCTGHLVEEGYTGDFVICSEPTQLGIALQAKGVLRLNIEVEGTPAHGSRPWEGMNAIEMAYEVHQKIKDLPFMKESSEYYPTPSLNLAMIEGGDAYNKVPGTCMLKYDIRYLPEQTKDDVVKQIENAIDSSVYVSMFSKPVRTDIEDYYVQKIKAAVEKNTGSDAVFFGQHGAADTQFFAQLGIPAIEFGPVGENWHGNKENVEVDSLYMYQKMLEDFAHSV
ncbi:M20 family metallopeptidase [Rossellomorea aquimaris]|uniref:M20/M25/M40 family metallo-hydrolase n=1 Tax=Rossellomorea aquimaris TaxID=189382 RepID=A0A5D4TBD0_9BACI|nr:M20/M25/M40 family metallo-hydrolase [Rossellomorea aquimaris]TYS72565.1 M20/M25/M40 family metallo-hydrolase [Rossellomorea aquimaris]